MNDAAARAKALIAPLRAAMYDFRENQVRGALADLVHPDAEIHIAHPLGDMIGPDAFYRTCYAPLFKAIPDLERRDFIVIAGDTAQAQHWVGCAGHYMGSFMAPWLDIPPTGHLVHMRFHEFYRIENDQIIEVQALWDIPEVMMQAGAWPMAPSLGREGLIPGPAPQDGLSGVPRNAAISNANLDLILNMLTQMQSHPQHGGPEVMQMDKFWHPRMNWYGPAGIGTARGIAGFRHWHQIPFLNAMPDRGQYPDEVSAHFFAENAYVGVTGWPDMRQTLSAAGWLGIPPVNKKISLKSLDFWRIEDGLIRENWVLVDLLDMYSQIGVDVFARLREFNKARPAGRMSALLED